MTNFEKVIKNLDSHALAYMLYRSGACPFPHESCETCDLHKHHNCQLPNDRDGIITWLEQEVEE